MPPTLPDELLEEIFLRLPPDEPACLLRASLASKLWLGLLTGPAFHGRYREFHGAPPMLGFLLSWMPELVRQKQPVPHFVSTAKFSGILDKHEWVHGMHDTQDCRHGRVLIADTSVRPRKLAVWDPKMGCQTLLRTPPDDFFGLGAAVLCAVTGCHHRTCHQGPFQVLLFGLGMNGDEQHFAHVWVFSLETYGWSEPCSALHLGAENAFIEPRPSVLFGNALYHTILYPDHISILKYDLCSNHMSLIDGPPLEVVLGARSAILMTMEDGSLGFTYLDCLTLYRWSRQFRSDGLMTWTQHRVVDLTELLPIQNPKKKFRLIGFKEGSGIIFVTTDLGICGINLMSLEWKKLWKRENIRALIPYMSFYDPPDLSFFWWKLRRMQIGRSACV